jgi:hypothetical protein
MKKIETAEERLKQDEYGLYINAPNYPDQRSRLEHELKRQKELENKIPKWLRWLIKD